MKSKDFTKPTHKMVKSSKKNMAVCSISVVIPTYLRENVLLDTINFIINLEISPAEIIIVDQTTQHTHDIQSRLENLNKKGIIRWVRLERPSIPHAMNIGLLEAKHEIVLFLDDDIIPDEHLVRIHAEAHKRNDTDLVAGLVIQPWDIAFEKGDSHVFRSFSTNPQWADEFMGGNFSINRLKALEIGGFDENFVKVAYRFERDFADRLTAAGGKILFEPKAVIKHLKLPHGGTRSYGNHLTTFKPNHAVGEYYYLLRTNTAQKRLRNIFLRPLRAITTNHHLHRPWWIPITLTAEILGVLWAISLAIRGPRYLGWDQQV